MESKYRQLLNEMQSRCNELDNCIKNSTFNDYESIDNMRQVLDCLTVACDALGKNWYRNNYELREIPKETNGSYKKIYVHKLDNAFDGYWTEGTPETIREVDFGQDYGWSLNDPSEWGE